MKTIKEIRDSFWNNHPEFEKEGDKRQNNYKADIRAAFVFYVDYLHRDGIISDSLANKVTL